MKGQIVDAEGGEDVLFLRSRKQRNGGRRHGVRRRLISFLSHAVRCLADILGLYNNLLLFRFVEQMCFHHLTIVKSVPSAKLTAIC